MTTENIRINFEIGCDTQIQTFFLKTIGILRLYDSLREMFVHLLESGADDDCCRAIE